MTFFQDRTDRIVGREDNLVEVDVLSPMFGPTIGYSFSSFLTHVREANVKIQSSRRRCFLPTLLRSGNWLPLERFRRQYVQTACEMNKALRRRMRRRACTERNEMCCCEAVHPSNR